MHTQTRTEGAEDDGNGLREPPQDVVSVLDGDGDEKAAKGVHADDSPRDEAEAVERSVRGEERVVAQVDRANRDQERPDAKLDVAQP